MSRSPRDTRKSQPPPASTSSSEDESSDSEQSTRTTDFPSAQFVVDQANRRRANREETQRRLVRPSQDLGDLPDVGSLELNSPSSTRNRRSDNDDMSKAVTFSGKPSQLDACLTHCKVKLLADGVTSDSAKAAYLASLLRGPALTWLTQKIAADETILDEYDELKAQLQKDFGIDDESKRLQAARALTRLRQKGSVREYAQKFDQLASEAGLNEQTSIALFSEGLKPKVREGLIYLDNNQKYEVLKNEATRIDTQLYYSQKPNYRSGSQAKHGPKRGKDGKFEPKVKSEW
jgi:hypothetical protein